MYEFNGKIALITGGASGIGYSICKEILRGGAQAITIVDINEQNGDIAATELTKEFGPNKVIFLKTDVTRQEELEGAFKKTLSIWKGLDILVNCAGVFNGSKWELEISLNVTSLVRGTLLGLQYMGKDKGGEGGVIINISSIAGIQEAGHAPVYTGTKHFVVGFTRSLGTPYHYERTGVRFITICPGFTVTDLCSNLLVSDTYFMFPDLQKVFKEETKNSVRQSSDKVAEGIITSIREGSNGSIWVAEDNEIYEVVLPDRKTLRK